MAEQEHKKDWKEQIKNIFDSESAENMTTKDLTGLTRERSEEKDVTQLSEEQLLKVLKLVQAALEAKKREQEK